MAKVKQNLIVMVEKTKSNNQELFASNDLSSPLGQIVFGRKLITMYQENLKSLGKGTNDQNIDWSPPYLSSALLSSVGKNLENIEKFRCQMRVF